ncbi:MAG: twin-arginine translocase subunit TatC, partial [Halobacteriota archaeon]
MTTRDDVYAGSLVVLEAARQKLGRILLVFVVGMLSAILFLRWYAFDAIETGTLRRATEMGYEVETSFVNPFEVILLQAKIGIVVGVVLALPFALHAAREPLKRRGVWPDPRWTRSSTAVALLIASAGLFVLGVAYAYLVMVPYIMQFVVSIAVAAEVTPFFRISSFIGFVLVYSLVFGLMAQFPLVMAFTVRSGMVSYDFYRDRWRHFVVGGAIASALVTSPDPFTQLVVLGPFVGIYFLGLGVARFLAAEQLEEMETSSVRKREPDVEPAESAGTTTSGVEAAADAVDPRDELISRGLVDALSSVIETVQTHSKKLAVVFVVVSSAVFYWLIVDGVAMVRDHTLTHMEPALAEQVELVQLEIFEFVFLVVKYSVIAGVAVTLPMALYLGRSALVRDGVVRGDGSRWYYFSRIGVVVALFALGAAYAYYGMVPVLVSVLTASIVDSDMIASYTIGDYVDFVVLVTVLLGFAAQLPAVMYVLVDSKIARYETLKSKWRHYTIGVFAFGALVTSPDPFTMVVVAVPLSGFYLVSLGVTRVLCHGTITRLREERR